MDREIFVHIDLHGRPLRVGRLWSRTRRGRVLMRRAERHRAAREGRTPRTLSEADFLLMVDDEARQGALRFAEGANGPFLAAGTEQRIPPLVELPKLLSAAERVGAENEDDSDLRLLLAPGSSLGGARPKSSVRDNDGHLALAKFPHAQDEVAVVLWEGLALSLAKNAGIIVPKWRIERIGEKPAIVIRRFDREGNRRTPFLSAMSMLTASENESRSYMEIADAVRQHGAEPKADLSQLWRRIVFNVLISNGDDHLRNHGFLYSGTAGWRLAPAYDLNPVPVDIRPRVLSTAIDLDDPTASLDLALETAVYYGLTLQQAKEISVSVAGAVSQWRREAANLDIPSGEIDRMATAFDHADMRQALSFRP